jgi:hypothetical protein
MLPRLCLKMRRGKFWNQVGAGAKCKILTDICKQNNVSPNLYRFIYCVVFKADKRGYRNGIKNSTIRFDLASVGCVPRTINKYIYIIKWYVICPYACLQVFVIKTRNKLNPPKHLSLGENNFPREIKIGYDIH